MIRDCKVNHMVNPLGFELTRPVFTWKGEQDQYRLVIAADEDLTDIVYDSGMTGLNPLCTRPELKPEPCTRYYWSVGGETQWFETARGEEPWKGRWITCDRKEARHPVFSKTIVPKKEVASARLYICGLGLYEAFLDGEKIGCEHFAPFCNDYNTWVQYQTNDITRMLGKESVLSVLLGNGWYGGRFGFRSGPGGKPFFGDDWKLIAEVHIRYSDGTREIIGTDESWEVTRSTITFSNIYDGEHVDDTLPDLPAVPAAPARPPEGKLTARKSVPVTVHEEITVKEIIRTPAGEQVLDMGQNLAGLFRIRVRMPRGEKLHLQFGEILQEGNFYRENLRTAKAEYIWISDGEERILEPRFTYYGFRYVKVTGTEVKPEDFTALAVYSEIPAIGRLTTGNQKINQLISNTIWSQKGNFLDVPTDCPQRDERMGWTGDAQVFAPAACYLTDSAAFYHKYLTDMNHEQAVREGAVPNVIPSVGNTDSSAAWGDAATVIPWTLYQFTGDISLLESHYSGMTGWVDYCRKKYDDGSWLTRFHFGDWLALDGTDGPEGTRGGTDEGFVALGYLIRSARIVRDSAVILGKTGDAEKYGALADRLTEELHREYYSPGGRCCVDTQTAHLMTLAFRLHPNREKAAAGLANRLERSKGKLQTGFVGTPILCPALSQAGMHKDAYRLLLNEGYPGWLYAVNLGATTIWERWNSVLPDGTVAQNGMNSLNHYACGSIVEWIWKWAAGIEAAEPGFRKVRLHPIPSWQLRRLDAVYDSASGCYEVHWECVDDRHLKISVTVPYGCEAELTLPLSHEKAKWLCAGAYTYTYETTEPLCRALTTRMPLKTLLAEPEAAAVLGRVIPGLSRLPDSMQTMTLREAAAGFGGGRLGEEIFQKLDDMLAAIKV